MVDEKRLMVKTISKLDSLDLPVKRDKGRPPMIHTKQCISAVLGFLLTGAAMAADVPVAEKALDSVGAGSGPAGKNATTPSSQYVTAYNSMTQADWLKNQGMPEEAMALYTEAQTLFQKLAADSPLWETNVVAFRLKYCADEMVKFRLATATTGTPTAQASSVSSSTQPRSPTDKSRDSERLRVARHKESTADIKGALATYLTILENQPQSRAAITGAGRCYLRLGMPENAQIILQSGMALPNPDAELSLLMALVYCHGKEFYKAYQLLLIVLNEQPTNAIAHLAMGVAQAGLNKMDAARVETQKAIQLNPRLGDAYYNLARLCLKLKPSSPGIARGHYQNALQYGATRDPALEKQFQ